MNTIQAIETKYAGCRFRSRLEARWAVFFDTLGIAWEYEPQGFAIPRGDGTATPYLPDFLLPECGTWIEVKARDEDLDRDLMRSAAANLPAMPFRCERGPRLMILGSIPAPLDQGDYGWKSFFDHEEEELEGGWDYGFSLYGKNLRPWGLFNAGARKSWVEPTFDEYEPGIPEAYAAARSARFEHGESGV